jgi:alkylation response protein AidB-like acyl-CoA dehydrogenase
MDLTPDDLQRQILDSVDRILKRGADPQATRKLLETESYDTALHEELAAAGFLDLPVSGAGPLEAALVCARVAESGALVTATATGLVYPMLTGEAATGPVALADGAAKPFRMGQFAHSILILDGERALHLTPSPGDVERVDNDRTGWPLSRLRGEAIARAVSLGDGSGERLRNWWRTAVAIDAAGAMRGAIALTVRYVSERVQFGRPIGSFQAIQHRLAQMAVQAEGAYWLALEAAFHGANGLHAARAATWATTSTPMILRETQQMHGAMGFTREYPLHLWTMRLPALQRELGGLSSHARATARMRRESRDREPIPASRTPNEATAAGVRP